MDLAIELLHAEKGLILIKNIVSNEVQVKVARAIDKTTLKDVVAMSHSVVRKVCNEGQPVFLQQIPAQESADTSESIKRYKLKSVICVPLNMRDDTIGAIYLDTTNPKEFFNEQDVSFLEAFANLSAIAIENAKKYQEIEELNKNLEKLVEDRTAKLRKTNEELKEAYQNLKDTQLQLIQSEKMASLGKLVAGISHEINSPLGSIHSNTDIFMKGFEKLQNAMETELKISSHDLSQSTINRSLEVLKNICGTNQDACQKIMRIIKSLQNFARLDEEEMKTVDIHEGINSTVELIPYLQERKIEIIKEFGRIPKLYCNARELNQVFLNLLHNACEAIQSEGFIRIQTYLDNNDIYIQVIDSGKGMDTEELKRIFDPGYTTKGVGVGIGLGLSICYKIIEGHEGNIEVKSEPGKGSTFTIKLPIARSNRSSE
jgi:signal transduction histidine kinase